MKSMTVEQVMFELARAAEEGCRSYDDLVSYFMKRGDTNMKHWVIHHPVTACDKVQEIIKA